MWVMTTGGFVSAVEDADREGYVSVRARDRQSLVCVLDAMAVLTDETLPEIREGEGTDYAYRVSISKINFALWLSHEVLTYVSYRNFKDEVTRRRGAVWHDALMDVWSAMMKVTDKAGQSHGYYAPTIFQPKVKVTQNYGNKRKRQRKHDTYPF